jgi:cytochrome P450
VIFPSVVVAGTPQPPLESDPPDHSVYRKMIQKHFTRPAAARYEGVLRELAVERIGELVAAGAARLVCRSNQRFTAYLSEQIGRQREAGADTLITAIAGDRIALVISSANRDPLVFDHPDEFRCPRAENPHLSFGYGVHRCVGEHLARLQMKIVAEEVLRLMPAYRLADDYQPAWQVHGMMRGLARLPAVTARPVESGRS